uniref:HDAg domain-containing protein n=1 Tax=Heliothis virescens TaxID=7102 RepID=A0A2A4IU97_HELVI
MANVRDSDTSLWLHNKLGTSNDSWTSGSICTQLNAEVLKNIKDCFPDLQTQVKLKLLLSFFHIPRRNVEEWRNELEEIIEVAAVDSDLWVAMLAETLKTFPSAGTLNTEIAEFDETRPIFSDMISELRRALAKHSDLGLLPLECLYLNKNALVSVVGQQPNPVKHFTLKRKPKSVALRSELLAKATEVQANQKKAQAPTVPVRSRGMPRKMTDTTPLKGLPSRFGGCRGGTWRGAARPPPRAGIKLLDIAEQPATHAQIKKRRKLATAAGLVLLHEAFKALDSSGSCLLASQEPEDNSINRKEVEKKRKGAWGKHSWSVVQQNGAVKTDGPRVHTAAATATPDMRQPVQIAQTVQQPQVVQAAAPVQQPQQQAVQQPQQNVQPAQQQPLLPRRGLSLTREQMLEAQDMFRNANRVTRPEKALILGFMAGSRDNPCPNLGNIVTIKLSENIENVLQSDDTYLTMLSEMHFQMNYNNGQWTRLKKYRHIDGMVPQKIPPGSTVISTNNQQPIVSIANQSVS